MTRRQVFGLTGAGAVYRNALTAFPYGLPERLDGVPCAVPTSVASQLVRASAVDAFVPDYRCGAVPELHRVPFLRPA